MACSRRSRPGASLLAAVLLVAVPWVAADEPSKLRLPPAAQIVADASEVVDARQIVVLARSAADAELLLARELPRHYQLHRRQPLPALRWHMLVLRLPPGTTGAAAVRELEQLVPGVTAGVNHAYKPAPVSVTPTGRSYASAMMGWPVQGCAAGLVLLDGVCGASDGARTGLSPSARLTR